VRVKDMTQGEIAERKMPRPRQWRALEGHNCDQCGEPIEVCLDLVEASA
jgi:hypothetical protein